MLGDEASSKFNLAIEQIELAPMSLRTARVDVDFCL